MESITHDFSLIRPIRPEDDAAVAAVIRSVMPEFGADGPGFAIHDPEVDHMSRAYSAARAAYFVVELEGRVVGGAGVGPLEGAPDDICELRKMYFMREARGRGLGRRMLEHCMNAARARSYRTMYLETLSGMEAAQHLYAALGFSRRACQLGATGHFACDRYYERAL